MEYSLKTKIERIIYFNSASNWGVALVENTTDKSVFYDKSITVAGNFEGFYEGCLIELRGTEKVHPRYGKQIEISYYKIVRDNTNKESIVNFLSKSTIKGISIQNAIKIYNRYKEHSIDMVLYQTEKLKEIKGIGDKTIQKIKDSVETYKDMEDLLKYCLDLGFTHTLITKLYKNLGRRALDILKEDIYSVLYHTDTISFKQLDNIALNNGVSPENESRVRHCFLYVLKNLVTFEGSTGTNYRALEVKVMKELGLNNTKIFSCMLNTLDEEGVIYVEGNKIFYKPYYDLERSIADNIINIVNNNATECIDAEDQYYTYEINENIVDQEINNFPFELNPGQINAIKNSLNSRVGVITGSAGVGKSTILKALVNIYSRNGWNVVQLAPTGKATRRIEECTLRPAYTIHKFLKIYKNIEETEVEKVPMKTVIFVDESSMLDILIFNKLLESFNVDTRLILLGDIKQLPSVQAGNVMEDLMTYSKITTHVLTDIMRQAEGSAIIANCAKINNGETFRQANKKDFFYKKYDNQEVLLDDFLMLYDEQLLLEQDLNNIQVITPYKKNKIGVNYINSVISDIYNKNELDEKFGYKVGDKVMQIRNNYTKSVFNGETGIVSRITEDNLTVDYNGICIGYEIDEIDEIQLAYVATAHKCQGSEYATVFVLLDNTNPLLLIRKVLYTAVSRGKGKVYILSMGDATERAIKDNHFKERTTKLSEFLNTRDVVTVN